MCVCGVCVCVLVWLMNAVLLGAKVGCTCVCVLCGVGVCMHDEGVVLYACTMYMVCVWRDRSIASCLYASIQPPD